MTRAVALAPLLVLCAASAGAQTAGPPADAPTGGHVEFLSRFAFHLSGEHLTIDDPRYVWDANYGGEIDLVDYKVGRATFYANYQTILGEQFRAFDPNQGNYILGALVSVRLPGVEAAVVFHHESRHLSDRSKRFPIDWNMLGARVGRELRWKGVLLEGSVDVRGVVQHSFVDYRWEASGGLRGRYPVRSRLALISDVRLRRLGVDGSRNRGDQIGARGEGGVRLEGRGAAVELFAAAERRIDPHPLTSGTVRWVGLGFRLASR